MTQPPGSYPPPQGQPPAAQPNNHLVLAILVTVFCGCPSFILGIIGIVKAAHVNSLWSQGRYAEAQAAADAAKKWSIWGIIIGVVIFVIWAILLAVGAVNFNFDANTTSTY
jgi:hypothetical protein